MNAMRGVLELARWAPSGDNTQPWRFEIVSESKVLIHGSDTRDRCVYDLDGWASQLSHGALLETVSVAATRFGCRAHVEMASEANERHITYSVVLERDASIVAEDPLAAAIRERTVQRLPMSSSPLSVDQRRALEQAVGGFQLMYFDAPSDRLRLARLNVRNAHIRLTIPEAFEVHRAVIAWGCKTSEDRLPDAALGAGPLLLAMMRNAMSSWQRVEFLNRYAGGTLLPRLMLDLLPGIACASHVALIAPTLPASLAVRVSAGRAMQRMWLTATRVGLQMQPSYTPLVFARYAREARKFTRLARAQRTAGQVARRLDEILGRENAARAVFLARVGLARSVAGRSLRLPLERLIIRDNTQATAAVKTADRRM